MGQCSSSSKKKAEKNGKSESPPMVDSPPCQPSFLPPVPSISPPSLPLPLLNLHSLMLEKTISKLDWKSYFRLQQTCRYLEELVRTNRNIEISWDSEVSIAWARIIVDTLSPRIILNGRFVDLSCVYGIRFHRFSPEINPDKFDFKYGFLHDHRITGKYVSLTLNDWSNYSKEQCLALLKTFSPGGIHLNDTDSLEALLEWRKLEEICLAIQLDTLLERDLFLTKQFLRKGSRVLDFRLDNPLPRFLQMDELLNFFILVLQFLRSEPQPHLRKLIISGLLDQAAMTVNEQLVELAEFNPVYVNGQVRFFLGPNGPSGTLKLKKCSYFWELSLIL